MVIRSRPATARTAKTRPAYAIDSVDHALRPNLAVGASYIWRKYDNFRWDDTVGLSASDYSAVDYTATGTTNLSVNLPTVALHGSSVARFALLHRNVPGVLARIDALVGEHGLNVDGQVLGTRGELGYVVTDVNAPLPPRLVAALQEFPETIRLVTPGPTPR